MSKIEFSEKKVGGVNFWLKIHNFQCLKNLKFRRNLHSNQKPFDFKYFPIKNLSKLSKLEFSEKKVGGVYFWLKIHEFQFRKSEIQTKNLISDRKSLDFEYFPIQNLQKCRKLNSLSNWKKKWAEPSTFCQEICHF